MKRENVLRWCRCCCGCCLSSVIRNTPKMGLSAVHSPNGWQPEVKTVKIGNHKYYLTVEFPWESMYLTQMTVQLCKRFQRNKIEKKENRTEPNTRVQAFAGTASIQYEWHRWLSLSRSRDEKYISFWQVFTKTHSIANESTNMYKYRPINIEHNGWQVVDNGGGGRVEGWLGNWCGIESKTG